MTGAPRVTAPSPRPPSPRARTLLRILDALVDERTTYRESSPPWRALGRAEWAVYAALEAIR